MSRRSDLPVGKGSLTGLEAKRSPTASRSLLLPTSIVIRDVGPRDGLQAEELIPVSARIEMIEGLFAAGLRNVEICSFVSPKAVPSMAGGAEVVARVGPRDGFVRAALVPNLRGAQMALDAGIDEITVTVSASEIYSQRNVGMSVADAVASSRAIAGEVSGWVPNLARQLVENPLMGLEAKRSWGTSEEKRVPIDAVVSCAFGSPYEGDLAPSVIAALCDQLLAGGANRITLADTTGMATPARISAVLEALSPQARTDVGLHLHETRGTGLVNAYSAMQLGVRRFDTSVGGLGGSPFAAGAAGNLATEDLVYLCDDLGVKTGIDLSQLLVVSAQTALAIGHHVPSRVAAAGPRLSNVDLTTKVDH
jgi:hydroxymethylglutaryl-CoA lyase